MTSTQIREELVEILHLDLIGPSNNHLFARELLFQAPHRWYLTGYLVPQNSPNEAIETTDEDIAGGVTATTEDENEEPETQAKTSFLPSSIGASVMIEEEAKRVSAIVRWGDYVVEEREEASKQDQSNRIKKGYRRIAREEKICVSIDENGDRQEHEVPESRGLTIVASCRSLPNLPQKKMLSVFVRNNRKASNRLQSKDIAFQVELELKCDSGFLKMQDLREISSQNQTEDQIANLHYRDVFEFAAGHGVSIQAHELTENHCKSVRTTWIPAAEVPLIEHTETERIGEVELEMERLGELADGNDARECLGDLVKSYRKWICHQKANLSRTNLKNHQQQTANDLIDEAEFAAKRIEEGIDILADPICLKAFRIANRAMAQAARQRLGAQRKEAPCELKPPRWRAFQIAYILMNLNGLFDPQHPDRKRVDLLFFPTGGGKTEAYLGLAAFAIVVRRLQNPGITSAGVSILMRYTLRLLTLDQLGRATALICALELERKRDSELGDLPFEIGLWVGSATTPNGIISARNQFVKHKSDPEKHSAPIPIEQCPWCQTKFSKDSFAFHPNSRDPTDLHLICRNDDCDFSKAKGSHLPIVCIDEPIYRRLPCFLIATIDKFATLPWLGEMSRLFGKIHQSDGKTAILKGELLPPDLIIQDELHLISGPLGTIAGVYETAIDSLCHRRFDGKSIVPKIVASTATVRGANRQIRSLFGREKTSTFPPLGIDRNDSFFAHTTPCSSQNPGRLYLGIAAQGRSSKVIFLRTMLAILAAAKKFYERTEKEKDAGEFNSQNPCDPYMTIVGYFNSLRELGGSRRIIEDDVYIHVQSRQRRRRIEPNDNLFSNRNIKMPVELTSRVSTSEVAKARRRLACEFHEKDHVDVALATNMISVGLDIARLGLMIVNGQPKTSSEYIQATSRIGRDKKRPGLVITLLNVHRPRDRSHYEHFITYHQSFYRSVEATSITPFSPRALDRGLAGAMLGLCRHQMKEMNPNSSARLVENHLEKLRQIIRCFGERARIHDGNLEENRALELEKQVHKRAQELLEKWAKLADQNSWLCYQKRDLAIDGTQLIRDFLDPEFERLDPICQSFRAGRSMRDVEPSVNILIDESSIGTNL